MTCSIEGCDRTRKARGWCNAHYLKWWAYGDPFADNRRTVKPCTLEGCTEVAEARGLCHRHYQRWKYQQNPDKFKRWERERRQRNPERARAMDNARHAANPAAKRAGARRRKMRLKGAEGSHTQRQWLDLLRSVDGECVYCGATATTRDHVIPLVLGGTDHIDNIVPACLACNCSKEARTLDEWMAS